MGMLINNWLSFPDKKILTKKQKECGNIKNKTKIYIKELRCWLYLKKKKYTKEEIEEIKQRYLDRNKNDKLLLKADNGENTKIISEED